jgi:hypothetical protein
MIVKVLEKKTPGILPTIAPNTRKNALSRVMASRASELEIVVDVRKGIDGYPVPFANLEGWIKEEQTKHPLKLARPKELFGWYSPGSDWPNQIPVPRGSLLEKINSTAIELAKIFPWNRGAASVFLICGETPSIPAVTLQIPGGQLAAAARVTLDVDIWQKPSDVASLFKRVQRRVLKNRKRQRSLSQKHLTLAVFAAENKQGTTYRELKLIWNKRHRVWRYVGSDEHFAKDCKRAQDRLLMDGLRIESDLAMEGS